MTKRKLTSVESQRKTTLDGIASTVGTDVKGNDILFLVEGEEVRASRLILSASCIYFKTMFSEGRWKESSPFSIPIEGVNATTFKSVLQFLYSGKVEIGSVQEAVDLLFAADMFGIQFLCEECILAFEDLVCKSTCVPLLDASFDFPKRFRKRGKTLCIDALDHLWEAVFSDTDALKGIRVECVHLLCDWIGRGVVKGRMGEAIVTSFAACLFSWAGEDKRVLYSIVHDKGARKEVVSKHTFRLSDTRLVRGMSSTHFRCASYTLFTIVQNTLLGVGAWVCRPSEPKCPPWWVCHAVISLHIKVSNNKEVLVDTGSEDICPLYGMAVGTKYGWASLLSAERRSSLASDSLCEAIVKVTPLTLRSLLQANLFFECSCSISSSRWVFTMEDWVVRDLMTCLSCDVLPTSEDHLLQQIATLSPYCDCLLECVRWGDVTPSVALQVGRESMRDGGSLHRANRYVEVMRWIAAGKKGVSPFWVTARPRIPNDTVSMMDDFRRETHRLFEI